MKGEILLGGMAARGPLLRLEAPISFWGGVDAVSGRILDVRHPDRGACVSGTILALPGTIGSSSSSSVLLELVRRRKAPAGLLIVDVDAILLVGLVVARELGWPIPPALRIEPAAFRTLAEGECRIAEDGSIEPG